MRLAERTPPPTQSHCALSRGSFYVLNSPLTETRPFLARTNPSFNNATKINTFDISRFRGVLGQISQISRVLGHISMLRRCRSLISPSGWSNKNVSNGFGSFFYPKSPNSTVETSIFDQETPFFCITPLGGAAWKESSMQHHRKTERSTITRPHPTPIAA